MSSIAAFIEQFWLIGLIVLGIVALAAIGGGMVRARERAKYRGPQYRRHT